MEKVGHAQCKQEDTQPEIYYGPSGLSDAQDAHATTGAAGLLPLGAAASSKSS